MKAIIFKCKNCGSTREKEDGIAPAVCAACGLNQFSVEPNREDKS